MRTSQRNLLRILIATVGLCILVVLFYRLGPQNILALFRQIGWAFLGVVLIYGVQELVRALAVFECLAPESRPAFKKVVHIRLIGEAVRAVTLTGPFLAEPTRAWFIKREGVRASEAVAATVGEYVLNGLVSALLTIAAVLYLFNYVEVPKELRVAGSVLLYGSLGYLAIAIVLVRKRSSVAETIAKTVGRRGTLPRLMVLQVVAHGLVLLETYWALTSMGVTSSIFTTSIAEILTKLANVAFVGMTEGAYAFLFHALGLPAAAGFTLSLVKRLRSFALAVVGLGSLALISGRSSENP